MAAPYLQEHEQKIREIIDHIRYFRKEKPKRRT
jgi:hypothetical protein